MLLQFSVENFLSFRDKVVFDLTPSKDKLHPNNVIQFGNFSASNTISITGANASGKSNLLKAVLVAFNMVRNSNMLQPIDKLPYMPFKFDKESGNMPTSFEFVFVGEDSNKYIYGFSYLSDKIVDEYLYVYSSRRPTMIFDRTNTTEYEFTTTQKKVLNPLTAITSDNKLFLCTSSAWNNPVSGEVIKWILEKINIISDLNALNNVALEIYKIDSENNSNENLNFASKLLQSADINISHIDVEFRETPTEMMPKIMFNDVAIQPAKSFQFEAVTTHTVINENAEEQYQMNLGEESSGTQQLFFLAPLIKKILDRGEVLFVDEIEKGLHPFIVNALIDVFRDEGLNPKRAQLIFTTHNTSLLDLDRFRRDQVYFAEKDSDTAVSTLYSLSEFSVRNTEDIQKGYLLGRYGAIPNIKGDLFNV